MGEKGVGKLSRETPPPREGEPMGAFEASGVKKKILCQDKVSERTDKVRSFASRMTIILSQNP